MIGIDDGGSVAGLVLPLEMPLVSAFRPDLIGQRERTVLIQFAPAEQARERTAR